MRAAEETPSGSHYSPGFPLTGETLAAMRVTVAFGTARLDGSVVRAACCDNGTAAPRRRARNSGPLTRQPIVRYLRSGRTFSANAVLSNTSKPGVRGRRLSRRQGFSRQGETWRVVRAGRGLLRTQRAQCLHAAAQARTGCTSADDRQRAVAWRHNTKPKSCGTHRQPIRCVAIPLPLPGRNFQFHACSRRCQFVFDHRDA